MAGLGADSTGLPSPEPEAVGPGHYATLGVHQGASRRIIMRAYDALEKRTVQELSYDELTADQKDAKDKRLEELRKAARILNDSTTRRMYDRKLRGERVSWAAEARDAYADYQDPDDPYPNGGSGGRVRSNSAAKPQRRKQIDRYRTPVIYPDIWIAAVDERTWQAPPPRSGSPFVPARRSHGLSRAEADTPRHSSPRSLFKHDEPGTRASPGYKPYDPFKDRH